MSAASCLPTGLRQAAIGERRKVGDELAERGLQAVLGDRKALLSDDTSHQPDAFKFNPYGIVSIDRH
jgi:hypothetical protein